LHDTCFIARITEVQIRSERDPVAQAKLIAAKNNQRLAHMDGSAANARFLLGQLSLLSTGEIERCVAIIAPHDVWKLGIPEPLGTDRLAVACLEADALWPLHPLGVMADLERPDEVGQIRDTTDPEAWQQQLRHSLKTLHEYRGNWSGIAGESFLDGESIFRT